MLRLDSSSVRNTMTEMTLRRMFDGCIDVTFEWLAQLVDTIDVKYMQFSNIASEDIIQYVIATSLMDISSSIASYWL